ncbi:DNase I-like protein [Clavulina sp. PMI_390]|nr:DNase I-like protein [Clavulina sp. PMI_390]
MDGLFLSPSPSTEPTGYLRDYLSYSIETPQLSPSSPGSIGDESSDVKILRSRWVENQLHKRSKSFETKRRIKYVGGHHHVIRPNGTPRIYISTFNVQGASPPTDLSSWLDVSSSPDLYVLGFQEVDSSTESFLSSSTTAKEAAWVEVITESLPPTYTKIASKRLVGIMLIIFGVKSLEDQISSVTSTSIGTGILNTIGNKGGVAIRLAVDDICFTFVNCHLQAYEDMAEKRNADYHELVRRLSFPLDDPAVDSGGPLSVFDCDTLFWMGDLNYRVDLPDTDVRKMLDQEAVLGLTDLFEHDELGTQMANKRSFVDFNEQYITFLPTYKITQKDDTASYDPRRRPAWTDRVLDWPGRRSRRGTSLVKPLSYDSHPGVTISDHYPVSAQYWAETRRVDYSRAHEEIAELLKVINVTDNGSDDLHVQTSIDTSEITFGEIRYFHETTCTICLENTGSIPAAFWFIPPKEGEDLLSPSWITLTPSSGFLPVGASVEIKFTALLTPENVPQPATFAPLDLWQTLILHVGYGKDHFLVASAQLPSSNIGRSLLSLARITTPIGEAKEQALLPEDQAQAAPRSFLQLIDWLMGHAVGVEDLFAYPEPDLSERCLDIMKIVDTGGKLPTPTAATLDKDAMAVASALSTFIKNLLEAPIPVSLYSACALIQSQDEAFELVSQFPSPTANLIISLTAFAHMYLAHSAKRSPLVIASSLGQTFFHARPGDEASRLTPLQRQNLFMRLLAQ